MAPPPPPQSMKSKEVHRASAHCWRVRECKAANGRRYSDLSGPLNGMPAGATPHRRLSGHTIFSRKRSRVEAVEVEETIRGLKVGKTPDPNSIPNRAVKHLPQLAITPLMAETRNICFSKNLFVLNHFYNSLLSTRWDITCQDNVNSTLYIFYFIFLVMC
jgi:hypothetical protein